MCQKKTRLIFLSLCFSASIFTNIYLLIQSPRHNHTPQATISNANQVCDLEKTLIVAKETYNKPKLAPAMMPEIAAPVPSTDAAENKKTPFDVNEEVNSHNLPLEIESMELSYERQFSRESFSLLSQEQQRSLINELVDSKRDREFVANVLMENHDLEVKQSAILKLARFNSFASTQLLINSLNNNSATLVKASVDALLKKGDRSLIPYLQEIQYQQSDVELERYIDEAINTLHYSARMGADGIAQTQ